MAAWKKFGFLDLEKLIIEEKIAIDTSIPVTYAWHKGNGFGVGLSAVTGQVDAEGRPNGFVRAYFYEEKELSIYEGFMDANCNKHGFGRMIGPAGNQDIGWYRHNKLHGNG